MFQNVGAAAYKEGLDGTLFLDEHYCHPWQHYRTIHVGGTNGKGSVSHTLAAILQAEGYRVGLYTSPHLVDFRERIRMNGEMIPRQRVIDFVEDIQSSILAGLGERFGEAIPFSFFELTTALAFKYFEEQEVDFAVVEVGLGGRLDCTNIIRPELSVITNISFDHVQFLGDTLPKIASEKAGIIKACIPVVIGEAGEPDVRAVFEEKAKLVGAPITFAEDRELPSSLASLAEGRALTGLCQEKNTRTILTAVSVLREGGLAISDESVRRGFRDVTTMTGLMGRWQRIAEHPLTICDTGHNVGGMQYIARQLRQTPHRRLHIVLGMVSDKDVTAVLRLLPDEASFYFTQASVSRAMPSEELARRAKEAGPDIQIAGIYNNVKEAYTAAMANADPDDLVFIGGSTFVVADLMRCRN